MGFPIKALFYNSESLSKNKSSYVIIIDPDLFSVGDIKKNDGTIVSRVDKILEANDKIEVTVGNYTQYIDLCVETFSGSMLYEASTTQYVNSIGKQNILVIPITFSDQTDRINSVTLGAMRSALGNIINDDGSVTTYFNENGNLTFSEFIYKSSYGKLTVNSFISEPYIFSGNANQYYFSSFDNTIFSDIQNWIKKQNINLSQFDQNSDGYFDTVIFINTLDLSDGNGAYYRVGMSGAFASYRSYYDTYAGTKE